MFILSQNSDAIYDMDKISCVSAEDDGSVVFVNYNGETFEGGKYANGERAKEVVYELYTLLDAVSRYEMPVI